MNAIVNKLPQAVSDEPTRLTLMDHNVNKLYFESDLQTSLHRRLQNF